MKHNEPVSRIMSTGVVTVHSGEPLSKVRKLMNETGFHHIPVVSGLNLIGLISWSDILRLSFSDTVNTGERAVNATLEQVMARDPITIPEDGKIHEAAENLAQGGFHSLPVVSGRRLVGMITTTDLIKYLHDQ
jgi:CBS domain-containing protein